MIEILTHKLFLSSLTIVISLLITVYLMKRYQLTRYQILIYVLLVLFWSSST